jgi:acyl phosphate:glycerol-3-phosphate acyltransferase
METIVIFTSAIVLAYLVGSIPTAVWVGRIFYKVDVRTKGSGNAGATNTIRVLGLKAGIPVIIIDILKGWLAVYLGAQIAIPEFTLYQILYLQIGMAAAAVLGHIFPIYVGFRGGKGVATLFGVGLALFPNAVLAVLGVFLLVFFITRMVSVSSVLASISFPFMVIFLFHIPYLPLILLAIAVSLFVPVMHHNNIKRLLRGEESKISFKRKST